MFSARTGWDRTPNRQTLALAAKRAEGRTLLDLTESNPTRVGLFDLAPLIAELGHARGALYEPAPLGLEPARAAVAQYYARRKVAVDPYRVLITASTSEAYAWLFSLLADPGDAVLVPRPSYPLLDWIAASQRIELVPYTLERDAAFRVDFDDLARAVTARTRAIVLVHPNNPTGSFIRWSEARQLCAFAREHHLALIVDEVFADYSFTALPDDAVPSFAAVSESEGVAIFVMSGLSKVLLAPQLKLGWVVAGGPRALVEEALGRLELIADTFLSVSTPVQLALGALLEHEGAAQQAARLRVAANLRAVDALLADAGPDCAARRLPVEGGWYVILEVPRVHDEQTWVETLLREDDVLVQPGYFFDFDRDGFLVLSLLPGEATFREAVRRVLFRVHTACASAG